MSTVIEHLRRTVRLQEEADLTDGQLLGLFIEHRDEAAFAALVRRHGSLVMGVCLRVLRNHQDAEDSFQATFLVLVRKAASLASRELLANWLYGVAYKTALKVRAATTKRWMREKQVTEMPEPVMPESDAWSKDLQAVLDQALSRLPQKYRMPIVLCDLEGKTRKEAARQLGCPEGSLSSRLARARTMLARRLARHGLALSGGALAAVVSQNVAWACVPPSVVSSTIKTAVMMAAGQAATTGVISTKVAALAEGVLKSMLLTKLTMATVSMLVIGILVGGVAGVSYPMLAVQKRGAGHDGISKPISNGDGQPQVTPTWKERIALTPQADKGDQIFAAAISPDGKTIATGQSKGAKLLDATTGKELVNLYQRLTLCTAFSPDGTMLATGHLTTVKVWDVTTGQERASLEGHTKNCHSVAFAPDSKTLATASETIRLWNVSTGGELRRFNPKGQEDRVLYCVAFSPDGKKLASAEGPDKSVKLWDVATGNELKTFQGHTKGVIAVAFSPDGKTLASAGGEGEIKLWDIASGKERLSRRSPTTGCASLAFSPDGKTLASAGGDDKTVLLWKIATGEELATLTEHEDRVWTVAFSRDGKTLVTAGDDAVRLWDAEEPPAKKK
jgi:RNA polymerase sigma factor (sigma-70 family)